VSPLISDPGDDGTTRIEYKATPGGVHQRRNGDARPGITIEHEGPIVYASADSDDLAPYAGALTTNINGEVPGWLGPGIYRTTDPTTGNSVTFEVGGVTSASALPALLARTTALEGAQVEIVAFSDRLPPALTNSGVPGNGFNDATAALEALAPGSYSGLATDRFRIEGECRIPQLRNIVGAGPTGDVGTDGTVFECVNPGSRLVFDVGYGGLSSGFLVDGMGVATNPLKLYIVVGRTFDDVKVRRSAGNGLVMEGCQNSTLRRFHSENTDQAGLVIDLGCGQNTIDGYEINQFGTYGVVIRQSAASPAEAFTVNYPLNNTFKGGIIEYLNASALGCVHQSAGLTNTFTDTANFQMGDATAIERAIFTIENGGGGYFNGELVIDGITAGGQTAGTSTFLRLVSINAARAAQLSGVNYINNFARMFDLVAGFSQQNVIDLISEPILNAVVARWRHGNATPGNEGGAPEHWFVKRPATRTMQFTPVPANSVPANSIFIDAADGLWKKTDASLTVTPL
jgi:hypothetical protein